MISVKESKKKKRKRMASIILLCVLLLVFILVLTPIIYMKRNGIQLIHGTITFRMGNIVEYHDGTFLIDTETGLYMNPYKTLDLINSQFHLNLQEGDSVYVFCKIDSHEIAPQFIEIFYIIKP